MCLFSRLARWRMHACTARYCWWKSMIMSLCHVTAGGRNVSLRLSVPFHYSHPAESQGESKYTCILPVFQMACSPSSSSSSGSVLGCRVFAHLSACLPAQRPYAYLMPASLSPWSVNGPGRALSQLECSTLGALETGWPAVHRVCEMSQHSTLKRVPAKICGHTEYIDKFIYKFIFKSLQTANNDSTRFNSALLKNKL